MHQQLLNLRSQLMPNYEKYNMISKYCESFSFKKKQNTTVVWNCSQVRFLSHILPNLHSSDKFLFFTAGFQLSGEWGRGVQQGSVGSDEDWDGIGREQSFLLSALLQCCHGTPQGELLKNLKWAYLNVCARNIVKHRTLLVCRFLHFYPDLYNKY